MTDVKNLHQRLVEAKRIVGETKLKKVDPKKGGGLQYGYLPVSRMKPVVADAEVQAGITRTYGKVRIDDVRDPWEVPSNYGGGSTTWHHKMMSLEIILTNADNPDDQITQTFVGEAKDNSDKVINKLYTSALKNYFKQIYDIAESEEDDTDSQQEPQVKVQPSNDSFFSKRAPKPSAAPDPKTDVPTKQVEEPKPEVKSDYMTHTDAVAILYKAEMNPIYKPGLKSHLSKCGADSIDDLSKEDAERIATLYHNVGVRP